MDVLELPVTYRGVDREFPFRVAAQGFITRYVIDVDGVEVTYERDDSGEWRAVIYNQDQLTQKPPDLALLQAISDVLVKLVG
jgi:hypothetical protein